MVQDRSQAAAFYVRMSEQARNDLKVLARSHKRSMNAEAVLYIERGIAAEKAASSHTA